MRVIRSERVIEDDWNLVSEPAMGVPEDGDVIVPYRYWREHREALAQRSGRTGVCIDGDDLTEEVAADMHHFPLIALVFPVFKDGRCYTHARLLRDRYRYPGELRAVGDVLQDQLFFLRRCGVDSFQVREDKSAEAALNGLTPFSVTYQAAADGVPPAYKNR